MVHIIFYFFKKYYILFIYLVELEAYTMMCT